MKPCTRRVNVVFAATASSRRVWIESASIPLAINVVSSFCAIGRLRRRPHEEQRGEPLAPRAHRRHRAFPATVEIPAIEYGAVSERMPMTVSGICAPVWGSRTSRRTGANVSSSR